MRLLIILLTISCLSLPLARADDTNFITLYTKLEIFDAQTGRVLIKGSADIGAVTTKAATLSIRCKETLDAATGQKEHGIVLSVSEENFPEHRSVVDYDELDSLLQGITHLRKMDVTVTALPDFQAVYRTRSDLKLLVYSSHRRPGVIQAALQTSRHLDGSRILLAPDQFEALQNLIIEAKANLDSLRK